MSSYRLTRRADRDLIDIYLYTFETFGLEQAERYTEGIRSCFAMLADNPRGAARLKPSAPACDGTSMVVTSSSIARTPRPAPCSS